MSCSLCRLPFTPSTIATRPRWPPSGVLTPEQIVSMKYALGMGKYVVGLVLPMVYVDNNMFLVNDSPVLINIAWETKSPGETEHRTFIAMHTHCATILRHQLGLVSYAPENLIELALLEEILGPTMEREHAGRFKDVNYETALGDGDKRVDINSLWSKDPESSEPGLADFDWHEWQRRELKWTAARPNTFPRFRPRVTAKRLSQLCSAPTATTRDIITNQPLDILHILLPYLDNKSFVNLLSTCRVLRHHALTTFQPHARERVLALGWAVPTEVEYADYAQRNPGSDMSLLGMAHATHSPTNGDWYLYLSQVHRTDAMRCRRWLWALGTEVVRVYREKRARGPYADVVDREGNTAKSEAWLGYAQAVRSTLDMRPMIVGTEGETRKNVMRW